MALLEIHDIHVFYDNIEALKGVSIKVERGQIVTLVGANGAGKTTTLRAVSGLLHPRSGDIRFDGGGLRDVPPHEIAARGVRQVAERRHLRALTVAENLAMGAFSPRGRKDVAKDRERMVTLFRCCGSASARSLERCRRRAADGRDRARADGGSARTSNGRA